MVYLYAKAVHIIFVVCWMAGLFYMVRLFIYHTEAKSKSVAEYEILLKQFTVIETKLWWIITNPSMYLIIVAVLVMLYINPGLLGMGWKHDKLIFLKVFILYHFAYHRNIFQLKCEMCSSSST